jgi:hypothetical protein
MNNNDPPPTPPEGRGVDIVSKESVIIYSLFIIVYFLIPLPSGGVRGGSTH